MAELLYDHIVVRYGELSTKGKNKKDFTKQLTQNIKKRLQDFFLTCLAHLQLTEQKSQLPQ